MLRSHRSDATCFDIADIYCQTFRPSLIVGVLLLVSLSTTLREQTSEDLGDEILASARAAEDGVKGVLLLSEDEVDGCLSWVWEMTSG